MSARRLWASLLGALTGAALAAPAIAEPFLDRTLLRKLEAGLICPARDAETLPAPGTALGTIRRTQNGERVVVPTRTVPMLKGLGFGVDVRPLGPRVLDPVTVILTHPPYPNNDVTRESWQAEIRPFRNNLNYFVFEFDEELVPGDWIFTFQFNGKTILSVPFEVVLPERFPGVEGLCDGDLIALLPATPSDTSKSF